MFPLLSFFSRLSPTNQSYEAIMCHYLICILIYVIKQKVSIELDIQRGRKYNFRAVSDLVCTSVKFFRLVLSFDTTITFV